MKSCTKHVVGITAGQTLTALCARAQEAADGLRDIVGPIEPPPEPPWLWILAGVAAFALAVALAAWLLRRRKPAPTPYDIARRSLDFAAANEQLSDDAFCVEITSALRHYFAVELELPAPRRTTQEFLALLKENPRLPEESTQSLARILELADLAKFARASFGTEERTDMLAEARHCIDHAQEVLHPPETETRQEPQTSPTPA